MPLRRVATRLEPGMLARIRALLAKAESTHFDAEAEAFTAKAQELMTRHRVDRASLADSPADSEEAVGRRLGVVAPYAEAKAVLLEGIASANGCRTVWSKTLGFATVFGLSDDVDGVEELYTSLLVQATSALRREGSRYDRYGRSRTTRFRRSFLIGFAARISQRPEEANRETVEQMETETGVALVPLLDARARRADEALQQHFEDLEPVALSVSHGEGYRTGVRVADQADLEMGAAGRIDP